MQVCPNCGEENPERARFCLACGVPLTPAAPPRGEARKTVTVVRCDVTGFTSHGERLDPESMRRVMGRYFDAMRAVIERHGGTVEKFIGDAVMAVFGIPVVHEDDGLRAVRAAIEMRTALVQLNDELAGNWGLQLQMRTALNTGEVVAGDPASGQTFVTGDPVNVAARLEQAAPPGEILLGEATARLVKDAAIVEALEPLTVKGKDEPLTAFRLLELRADADALPRRLDSPLVGRENEWTLLHHAFDRAVRERTCHLFTVLGSAGVGKSRLVHELVESVGEQATVVSGRCLSYGDGITFWPVLEAVRQAANVTHTDAPAAASAKITALLDGEERAEEIAERVAQTIGLLDVRESPEEAFWAIRKLFEALARRRPLVAIFEDIHWGEPTFLDLVEHLADWVRDAPILLVCIGRTELFDERPSWGGGKVNAASILLEPLSEEQCERLIENLLGETELPPDARRRIAEAAEGNPLFVEEMLAMLIDDGLLRPQNGGWRAGGDLSRLAVPATIHALLAARLDRLDGSERHVIERASVEGKVFHRGAVEELANVDTREQVESLLRALARRELIGTDRPAFTGQDCFRFRHILIRDAAYHGMPKELRAELHERFAAWLEDAAGDRVREWEEILGYQLEQAYGYRAELGPLDQHARELATRAGQRLAAAGRRALAREDMPAAAALLARAAELYARAAPDRLELLPDLGAALIEIGELSDANVILGEAVRLADDQDNLRVRWRAAIERTQMSVESDAAPAEELQRSAEQAIAVFEELGDEQGLSKAWRLVGESELLRGRGAEGQEALMRAVGHAIDAGDQREETESLRWLARAVLLGPTTVDEGILRCEMQLQMAAGRQIAEAGASLILGAFLAMRGQLDEARRRVRDARATFEELGLTYRLAQSAFVAGRLELLGGDPAAAERELRRGYALLEQIGERRYYLPLFAALLADAVAAQGLWEEPLSLTEAAGRAAGPGDVLAQLLWRSARARALAAAGRLEEAETLAREATALAGSTDFLWDHANALMTFADVLVARGRTDEAGDAARSALELYEQKGITVSAEQARARLASLVG